MRLQLGVLMVALKERCPMATGCCRPPVNPARARAAPLARQVVADRRAAQQTGRPASGLPEWLAAQQRKVDQRAAQDTYPWWGSEP